MNCPHLSRAELVQTGIRLFETELLQGYFCLWCGAIVTSLKPPPPIQPLEFKEWLETTIMPSLQAVLAYLALYRQWQAMQEYCRQAILMSRN